MTWNLNRPARPRRRRASLRLPVTRSLRVRHRDELRLVRHGGRGTGKVRVPRLTRNLSRSGIRVPVRVRGTDSESEIVAPPALASPGGTELEPGRRRRAPGDSVIELPRRTTVIPGRACNGCYPGRRAQHRFQVRVRCTGIVCRLAPRTATRRRARHAAVSPGRLTER